MLHRGGLGPKSGPGLFGTERPTKLGPQHTAPHHKWVAYSWHYNWSFPVYMSNSKEFKIFFTRDSLISLKLKNNIISPWNNALVEDLNSAECVLLWCLSIGHIQYLSFCGNFKCIILRNRAPIVEKSIQIILMMKNAVNSTVKYIMLQFKIAVFYVTI